MKRHLVILCLATIVCAVAYAQDERTPLARALDYDANALLLANLRPNGAQVSALANAAGAVGRLVRDRQAADAAALERNKALLVAEHDAFAQGKELTQDQETALQSLRDADADRKQKMYAAVDAEIQRLRRALVPGQAALVDWTAPAEAAVGAAADDTATVADMRALAGRLADAQRFIERMRYTIPIEYIETRQARIDEYLKAYDDPNTRQYADDFDWIVKHLEAARVVNERNWAQQAPIFAAQLLQRLGLLDQTGQQAPAAGQPQYNWWDVYYLLSDPQTPAMLGAIGGQ